MADFEVVDLGPTGAPEPGDEVLEFTRPFVTAEFWEDRPLGSFAESERSDGRTILVFTPMIGSFVAEYVWTELRDREWDALDVPVLGISVATPYAISAFLDEFDVPFGIFADPANEIASAYGIAHDLDGMAGVSEPRLAFFALEDGTVADAWIAREWPELPDYDDLEERFDLGG